MKVAIINKGDFIAEVFSSVKEAAKELNVSESLIGYACRTGAKIKGYRLAYMEEGKK